jgi:hypothetical protein
MAESTLCVMARTMASTEEELTITSGPGVPVPDPETPEITTIWNAGHIEVALAAP